jgi:hypothetical protein
MVLGGVREEIVSAETPSRTSHRVISVLPVRESLGEVDFIMEGDGAQVRWQDHFQAIVPGTGPLLCAVMRLVFNRILQGLARVVDGARR